MSEKKPIKVSLGTTICIFIIILLVIALGIVYYLGFVKNSEKINELEKQTTKLKTETTELKESLETSNTLLKSKEETVKQEDLYKIAIEEQQSFIDGLIARKDFLKKDFTDEEIILSLPDSSEGNIFTEYDKKEGFYSKASIEDIEKSAKKIFDKTINVKNTENGTSIIILDNDDVLVEVKSGMGVVKDELISVKAIGDNDYIIEFKHASDTTEIYKLTIHYENGNIIYKGLEK